VKTPWGVGASSGLVSHEKVHAFLLLVTWVSEMVNDGKYNGNDFAGYVWA
jgi:hypothetical protein